MCALARWSEFVMSATTDHFRVAVSSVEEWESLMPTTVKSVPNKRKIGMGVLKSLILEVLRQICFMSARNMASRKDRRYRFIIASLIGGVLELWYYCKIEVQNHIFISTFVGRK